MVKPLTLNLLWLIGLLLLIVAAFAVVAPSGELLRDYISFASSIASILLALVAIFYAFISNGSLTSTLNDVRSAATSLTNETASLKRASSGLSEEAEQIIRRLSTVPAALTELSGDLGQRLDRLASSETFREGNSSEDRPADKFDPGGRSLYLVFSLYLLHLAAENVKFIRLNDIFPDSKHESFKIYASGFIESLKTFNNCEVKIEGFVDNFMISSLGTLDLSYLAEQLDENTHLDIAATELLNVIRLALSDQADGNK